MTKLTWFFRFIKKKLGLWPRKQTPTWSLWLILLCSLIQLKSKKLYCSMPAQQQVGLLDTSLRSTAASPGSKTLPELKTLVLLFVQFSFEAFHAMANLLVVHHIFGPGNEKKFLLALLKKTEKSNLKNDKTFCIFLSWSVFALFSGKPFTCGSR